MELALLVGDFVETEYLRFGVGGTSSLAELAKCEADLIKGNVI